MQDAEMHVLYYEILHADRELVSIRSIDSITQSDLTMHSYLLTYSAHAVRP